jgi:flagellar biosynthetic protein FliP
VQILDNFALIAKAKWGLCKISAMKKLFTIILIFLAFGALAYAAPVSVPQIPVVDLTINAPQKPEQLVKSLNIVIILTLLVLAPSLVLVMTSFTRLIIVFSFLRQAIGTQQMPPTQILVSLAMVLTFFIMEPVGKKSYDEGIKPYMEERIGYDEAFTKAMDPFKNFMVKNTREKDLALFLRIRKMDNPKTVADIPMTIVIPAFMISEMKTAFEIGFLLFLPFLVIDMVVSSVLMSMGMMMLPPVMISLPLKLLLFVMVDGWNLIVENLVASFK